MINNIYITSQFVTILVMRCHSVISSFACRTERALMLFPFGVGLLCWGLCSVMCDFESFLVSQSYCFGCVVVISVLCLCLTGPLFVLWTVIVVFPGHTAFCMIAR